MKGWRTVTAIGLVFAAQAALADQAKTRGSDSSGSSRPSGSSASGSAGERHPSPGASHSAGSGRGYETSAARSSSGVGEWSEAAPRRPLTPAEQRHPRPGTGTGYRYPGYGHGGYYPYYGYGYPYYGYYGYWGFSPWYYGWGFDYSYAWPGAYGGYPYHRYYDEEGSLRVLVEPEETKVYVDGYYAGVVDDFDGVFQRLHVRPGRHQLTFKLAGHQTHRVLVYVPPGDTLKVHHIMVKGSESQVTEESLVRPGDEERERFARDRYLQQREQAEEPALEAGEGEAGSLRLDVEPRDASVYIDGEFRGAVRELRRLELPPGRHRIEIVRPGFRTVERDIEVKSGQSEDLEVRLER